LFDTHSLLLISLLINAIPKNVVLGIRIKIGMIDVLIWG
jgi:hypothetical protein